MTRTTFRWTCVAAHSGALARSALASIAVLLWALVSPACGDAGGDAPPRPETTSRSLLSRFDRAVSVRTSSAPGTQISSLSRLQPWCADDRLWFAAPRAGGAIRLPDVPFREGAVIELGVGLLPGSDPAPEGVSGGFRFRLLLDRAAADDAAAGGVERTVLLDRLLAVQGLVPGVPVIERLPLPVSGGSADLVLRVTREGASPDLAPAWFDLRLVQPAVPVTGQVLCVVRRDALLDMRHRAVGPGDSERVSMQPGSHTMHPSSDGPLLRQVVPGRDVFLVDRTQRARLSLRVIESAEQAQPQSAVRIRVLVDGVEASSIVQSGYSPMLSAPLLVSLGPPGPKPVRVELVTSWVDPEHAPTEPLSVVWVRPRVERLEPRPRQRAGQGPNVLLVVVDTLRADHLDLYGYGRQTAPNLSARAAAGVVFERAMSASSWTVPSMATLFTGQYAYTHGLYDRFHWMLDPDVPTLAEIFREAGMSTLCVMANPLLDWSNGSLRGFEQVESVPLAHAAQVNRSFTDWLDEHDDQRFFALLHYYDPHDPYAAPGDALPRYLPPEWHDRAGPKLYELFKQPVFRSLRDLPEGSGLSDLSEQDQTHVKQLIDLYDAEIASWDRHFEQLMSQLEARGLAHDTLVVITSDHGESFAEHGMLGHGRTLHDELLRVPLVLLNSGAAAGRRDQMVGLIDLAPTLLRLADVAPGALAGPPLVGIDLLQPERSRDFLFAQTSHGERVMGGDMLEMQAVITAEGKAVRVAGVDGLTLFELAGDPGEQLGQAAAGPLAERLHRALDDWESASRGLSGWQAGTGALDPDVEAAMRALGYLK